jgi:putative membrane protein
MIGWWQWRCEPAAACLIVLAGWAYALATGPLRANLAPGEPFSRAHALRFYAGLVLLFLALCSPLGRMGTAYLFSAHVTQELVIIYPAAGLLILGLPAWAAEALVTHPFVRLPVGWLLRRPVLCGAGFTLIVIAWHMPRPFEWALEASWGAPIQHLSILLASIFFWWPILSVSRAFPAMGYAGRILYLFCVTVALTALFSYILMADHAIYPSYEYAPRVFSVIDAVDDQVLGGILLSGVSSVVLLAVLGVNFHRWSEKDRMAGKGN